MTNANRKTDDAIKESQETTETKIQQIKGRSVMVAGREHLKKEIIKNAPNGLKRLTKKERKFFNKTTPGGLAFGRDMILNIPLITDLQQLQRRCQELIDQRLIAANTRRFSHDSAIGDEVLKLSYKPDKLEPRATGPFTITRVHVNGTLSIELSPGVIERINLRRVKPYRR
jgi:hypothetical protein